MISIEEYRKIISEWIDELPKLFSESSPAA
jgi:hypothetical protein